MSQAVQILEYVAGSAGKVDREAGVVRGVKILGLNSANGRRYLHEAVSRARGLYENRVVNVNHPAKPGDGRSAYDRFGRTVNVRVEPDGLYGDLEYLKSHPIANAFVEAAERMPSLFGFSHNARGKERRDNGEAVIESIESVVSVDLVSDPATVGGIFESKGNAVAMTTLKAMLESLKGDAKKATALKEMADAAGMGMDSSVATASDSPDEAIKAGFKAAIHAVVDDDSMDMASKLAKIKEILKAQERLAGTDKPADGNGGKPAQESKATTQTGDTALREELDRLKRKDRARELCEEAGVKPSAALLKALVALPDEADVKAIVEEQKGKPTPAGTGSGKPKSSERKPPSKLTESKDDSPPPDDAKALAGWLNS